MKTLIKNSHGFSHHILIMVLVVSSVAGIGAWRVYASKAACTNATTCENAVKCPSGKKFDGQRKTCVTKAQWNAKCNTSSNNEWRRVCYSTWDNLSVYKRS